MERASLNRRVVTLLGAVAWVLSSAAGATNGYFKQGYGTQNKAMGGVGMALSLDSFAPGTNAAGIAGMESRVDGSLALFSSRTLARSRSAGVAPWRGILSLATRPSE